MKKAMVMFLAAMVILSFRGCDLFKGPEMGSDIKAEMLKYLEDKYDEEFEVEYISFGDWLHPRTEMGAYPAGGDSVTDRFVVTRDKEDRRVILEDGYYAILIREEYEDYIREVVEKYFPDCKYYTEIMESTFNAALTKEVSLEEAMQIQTLPLAVCIYEIGIDEEEYSSVFNNLCEELLNLIPEGTAIFIGLEQNDFGLLTRQNYGSYTYSISGNSTSKVIFHLQNSWENGEVVE